MSNNVIDISNQGVKYYLKNDLAKSLTYTGRAYKGMNDYDIPKDIKDQIAYNYALTCYCMGNYKTAIPVYETLELSHHIGRYELSMASFHVKDIENGKKHYFNRYLKNTPDGVGFPNIPLPLLDYQSDNSNEDVLILNEQGLGDEIMFARGIIELANKVKTLLVQVYPENLEMFRNNFKSDNLTFFSERSLSHEMVSRFTRWSHLGTLWVNTNEAFLIKPHFENNTIDLGLDKSKIHIGFVISPNKKSSNSNNRSLDISFFKKLAKNPKYQLHNLSISDDNSGFTNYKDRITNLNDTLGIIENMDLVITADTGVAHLAACSKTPTIVAHKVYLDWRWTNGFYEDTYVFPQYQINDKLIEQVLGL